MNIKNLAKKYNFLPIIIFLVISIVTTFIWFRQGLMYAGGDVGLPTYNPKRIVEIISKVWWDDTAPGFPRPQGLASVPAELFLSVLQNLGFSNLHIQAFTLGLLFFLMGAGMYLLALEVFKKNIPAAFMAGFFYMVNPYMMVQVWHRFVHSTFFLAAALPFLYLFWKKWIQQKKPFALIIFIAINLIFSYMYSTLAYVVTVWTLLTFVTFSEIIFPWVGMKEARRILILFAVGVISFLLTNLWWLLPVGLVSPTLLSSQHTSFDSISTLIAISKQSIIPYLLAGLNPFYLFTQSELGDVFNNPIFLLIPYLILGVIFTGVYHAVKQRSLVTWGILFFLAVFLAKGAAAPFGYPILFGLKKIFFLGVFRNPFEKIGILMPFSASILFALGIITIVRINWKEIFIGKILVLIILVPFIIYHWPFWTGRVFGINEKRAFFELPSYYQQANDWLKSQKKDGRILHLPLSVTESAAYHFKFGYNGVESSTVFLTSNPSIAAGFNLPYLDDALKGINLMADLNKQDRIRVKDWLQSLNVRFIVLHYDIDWQASRVKNPYRLAKVLDSLDFIKKKAEFGSLAIYEIAEDSYSSRIILNQDFNYLERGNDNNPWFWFLTNNGRPFLSNFNKYNQFADPTLAKSIVVAPYETITIPPKELISRENALMELPAIRFFPDSPFYLLIRLKEFFKKIAPFDKKYVFLDSSSKRLVEAYKMQEKYPDKSIYPLVKTYLETLPSAFDELNTYVKPQDEIPTDIRQIFLRHRVILQEIANRASKDKKLIESALAQLDSQMVINRMLTKSKLKEEAGLQPLNRQVYRFLVPEDGAYEIKMLGISPITAYPDIGEEIPLQIDNDIYKRRFKEEDSFISLGDVTLKKGLHEVSFKMYNSVNLYKPTDSDEIEVISKLHDPKVFEMAVAQLYRGDTYMLSFDYWIKAGNGPTVKVVEDSDTQSPLNYGETTNQLNKNLSGDVYNKYWNSYLTYITPRDNSSKFTIQLIAAPWDDCRTIIITKKLCEIKEIRAPFERPSVVVFKNIKLYRILKSPLFLVSGKDSSEASPINVYYTNSEPLTFDGNFTLDKPAVFAFSETFHDGWRLSLSDGKLNSKAPKHVLTNMFGNGWLIEKAGNYQFRLEFLPQRYFKIGIEIGLATLVVLITGLIFKLKYDKGS